MNKINLKTVDKINRKTGQNKSQDCGQNKSQDCRQNKSQNCGQNKSQDCGQNKQSTTNDRLLTKISYDFKSVTEVGLSIFFKCTSTSTIYFFLKFEHFSWISFAKLFEIRRYQLPFLVGRSTWYRLLLTGLLKGHSGRDHNDS